MTGCVLCRSLVPALAGVIMGGLATASLGAEAMPEDFVYLRDVDPSIEQDIRYAGPHNFTGEPVPGYGASECILVRQAAEALKRVQADLRPRNLSLRVYDCYRPTQAVDAFVAWAKEPDAPGAKAAWYPRLDKSALFPDYIATRSGHSRGATLDLSIVPVDAADPPPRGESCLAPQKAYAPDGSLAMGTTFDCFDTKANTDASSLTAREIENRTLLRDAMAARGFENYPFEWWHYTYEPEPHPDTYFDFPIRPRPGDGDE